MSETLMCLIPIVLNMHKSFETTSEFTLQSKYKKFIEAISNEKFVRELSSIKIIDDSSSHVTTPSTENALIQKLFQCTSFCSRLIVALHLDTSNVEDQVRYILYLYFNSVLLFLFF
jgi:hypothetical protein